MQRGAVLAEAARLVNGGALRCRAFGDDHAMAGAVGGVDLAGAPGKLAQMRLGLAQFGDPPL
ncbi:MAG TPA: hypothetical protein VFI46_13010, partial [Jiangellaceae bacterium]|nr:hypothetical protein [Jiangellaceae bacterium]